MTSLSKALSLECGEIVSPETADLYFQQGKITDKRKFICVGDGCGCLITCVNIDKPLSKRKVDPYFRTVDLHSDSCNIYETNYLNTTDLGDMAHVPDEQKKSENEPDLFFMKRPKSHLVETRVNPGVEGVETVTKITGKPVGHIEHISPSNIYHLGSLVGKYYKYQKVGLLKKRAIDIGENSYAYSELFKRIKDQDFVNPEVIEQRARVYWGLVESVVRLKNGDVKIKFSESARFKTARTKVSVVIRSSLLKNYRFKRSIVESIEDSIGTDKEQLVAYVYGVPELIINDHIDLIFKPFNLDLFEIKKYNKAFKTDSQRLAFSV